MSSTLPLIRELMMGHTGAPEEARIFSLVEQLSAEDLNALLTQDGDRLFSTLDNRLFGPDFRNDLVTLVGRRRIGDLDLHGRAALLHALQVGRTSSAEEHLMADVLCGVVGAELTQLKNIVNLQTDRHALDGLIWADIDDQPVRQRILDHFAQQTVGVEVREAKVLSDIDDTVFCALHDRRYPKGTLYPGVIAFQEALDEGPQDCPRSVGDLTFVTARPGDVFGIVERHSRSSLRHAGAGDLSVLSGSLLSLRTLDAMAAKKVENITRYALIYPEYRLIFMGDSGQGDVMVGQRLWEEYPSALDAVFIHDVVDTPQERRDELASQKVWFHDTYIGAANKALELGLISAGGHGRVVASAKEALSQIPWEDAGQQERMEALMARDEGTTTR